MGVTNADKDWKSKVEDNKTAVENKLGVAYGQIGAGQYNSSAPTYADGDFGFLQLDSDGSLKTTATISGDVNVDNNSVDTSGLVGKASGTNADFVTAYASGTTLTCSSLPTGVNSLTADDVVAVLQIATGGAVTNTYTRDDITLSASGTDPTTFTVSGATFAATDTFVVYTNIQRDVQLASHTEATSSDRVEEIDPVDEHYVEEELVDTTNLSADTRYYPSSTGKSLGNFNNVSIHGVTSGGVTVTIEAKIDDSTDWVDITPAGYRLDDDAKGNETLIDQTFMLSFTDLHVRNVRIKSVTSDATNAVQLHWKLTAL